MVAASSSVGGRRSLTVLFWRAIWRAKGMVVAGRCSSIFDGLVMVLLMSFRCRGSGVRRGRAI